MKSHSLVCAALRAGWEGPLHQTGRARVISVDAGHGKLRRSARGRAAAWRGRTRPEAPVRCGRAQLTFENAYLYLYLWRRVGPDDGRCRYRLQGVVVHSGGIAGGHYVAYVRSGGRWFYISVRACVHAGMRACVPARVHACACRPSHAARASGHTCECIFGGCGTRVPSVHSLLPGGVGWARGAWCACRRRCAPSVCAVCVRSHRTGHPFSLLLHRFTCARSFALAARAFLLSSATTSAHQSLRTTASCASGNRGCPSLRSGGDLKTPLLPTPLPPPPPPPPV